MVPSKTNYAFRSVYLQPGTHKIEFVFKPKMFRLGLLISVITFLLLITGVIVGWRLDKRRKNSQEEEVSENDISQKKDDT